MDAMTKMIFLGLASAIRGLRNDTSGATAVEYGIIAAGISVAIIGSLTVVGNEVATIYGTISTAVSSAN